MLHETIAVSTISNLGDSQATLTSYCRPGIGALADKRGRWGVIICPGGGYHMLAPTEGEPVALRFLAAGVQAFVLHYSTLPAQYPQQLLELAACVAYLRSHGAEYGIDHVAVCGFSAGGHLCACLSNLWADPALDKLGVAASLLRPDAAILSYPCTSAAPELGCADLLEQLGCRINLDERISEGTPSTFLWCTCTDQMVPMEHTLNYAAALRRAGVLFELHVFPRGPHAMATATDETAMGRSYSDPHIAQWIPLCLEWLNKEGQA